MERGKWQQLDPPPSSLSTNSVSAGVPVHSCSCSSQLKKASASQLSPLSMHSWQGQALFTMHCTPMVTLKARYVFLLCILMAGTDSDRPKGFGLTVLSDVHLKASAGNVFSRVHPS